MLRRYRKLFLALFVVVIALYLQDAYLADSRACEAVRSAVLEMRRIAESSSMPNVIQELQTVASESHKGGHRVWHVSKYGYRFLIFRDHDWAISKDWSWHDHSTNIGDLGLALTSRGVLFYSTQHFCLSGMNIAGRDQPDSFEDFATRSKSEAYYLASTTEDVLRAIGKLK